MDYRLLKSESSRITFKERSSEDLTGEIDLMSSPSIIQLMKTGVFSYWSDGDMRITPTIFQEMCMNFESNARGIDLAVDYGHNNSEEAAGWITGLSMSDNKTELLATVKWTPRAAQMLKDGEYRYISAEWSDNYQTEGGEKRGPTLFGAGLTNRPFLKQMTPLSTLSETNNRETNMNIDELKASVELLQASVKTLSDENKSLKTIHDEKEARISFMENEKKELAEKAAKEGSFNKLLSEGKACEAQRESFIKGDIQKFSELSQDVHLKNEGHSFAQKASGDKKFSDMNPDEAEDKVLELAQAKMKLEPAKFADIGRAVSDVLFEKPELAKKYHQKFE